MNADSQHAVDLAPERGWLPLRLLQTILLIVFSWAYWPTLLDLSRVWKREADYSHGFLVIPFALLFLWRRRRQIPTSHRPAYRAALGLMVASVSLRYIGLRYALYSLDGYSFVLWCASVCLLFMGWSGLRWALPSVVFLLFMIPLPFQAERLLSVPLQRVATSLSSFLLQCLRQPAFAEGNTILLGTHQLFVEQACSGLRMFVGAFALAFVYLVLTNRDDWQRVVLLISVIPIALMSNAIRIVVTGLMYQYLDDDQRVQQISHDFAGMLMIPLAAIMFGGVLWYLSKLVQPVELIGIGELMRRSRTEN